jgi:hypothetical protein
MSNFYTYNEFKKKLINQSGFDKFDFTEDKLTNIYTRIFTAEKSESVIYLEPKYWLQAAEKILKEENIIPSNPATDLTIKADKDGHTKIFLEDELYSTPPKYKLKNKMEYIYVVDMDDRLFIEMSSPNRGSDQIDIIDHSMLANFKPVKIAGIIKVNNGAVEYLNNSSGHYKPSETQFKSFLENFVNSNQLAISNNFQAEIYDEKDIENLIRIDVKDTLYSCPVIKTDIFTSQNLSKRNFDLFASPPAKRPNLFGSPPAESGRSSAQTSLYQESLGNLLDSTNSHMLEQTLAGASSNFVGGASGDFAQKILNEGYSTPTGTPPRTPSR